MVKNQTIKAMGEDINDFRFNTAIARSMELFNKLNEYVREEKVNIEILKNTVETYITLLSPLAPHFAEEEWEKLGKIDFVYNQKWPEIVESEMKGATKEIPIQVNGKLKFCVTVNVDDTADEMLEKIKSDDKFKELLKNNNVVKEIYVPGKLVNIVAK